VKTSCKLSATVLLAACVTASASAGTLTYQGVTFTSSFSGNVLTLDIDAAHPSGDGVAATAIGALQVKGVGMFDRVNLTAAPGAAMAWSLSPDELNADGCSGGAHPDMGACFSGAHIALTDNMIFQFTFTGAGTNLTAPEVKVNFFAGDGQKKVGSLLSMSIPAVPEAQTYAMLFCGLTVLGALARRHRGPR
jgi:hypothetical protein